MAGGAQWSSVVPSGTQWQKSAAVGGVRSTNDVKKCKGGNYSIVPPLVQSPGVSNPQGGGDRTFLAPPRGLGKGGVHIYSTIYLLG